VPMMQGEEPRESPGTATKIDHGAAARKVPQRVVCAKGMYPMEEGVVSSGAGW